MFRSRQRFPSVIYYPLIQQNKTQNFDLTSKMLFGKFFTCIEMDSLNILILRDKRDIKKGGPIFATTTTKPDEK